MYGGVNARSERLRRIISTAVNGGPLQDDNVVGMEWLDGGRGVNVNWLGQLRTVQYNPGWVVDDRWRDS
jgi:hypothetical protein